MKQEWLDVCLAMSKTPADLYSGARKILRGRSFRLSPGEAVELSDCGFTKSKLTMLRRLYYSEEHTTAVAGLWDRRLSQKKYGSVSVSTYHHLTKSDPNKKSKRASVMGPCLVGVSFTLLNHGESVIDCFYRTTELYKKFPADLVFLTQVLFPHFKLEKLKEINFHFANITCHPMYFVTLLPSLKSPIAELEAIRVKDEYFYHWIVKWTARYLCDEYSRGIMKFSQALRVRMDALRRIDGKRLTSLQSYLRSNHPGYRSNYNGGDDEDGE